MNGQSSMKIYPTVPARSSKAKRKMPITRWGIRLKANLPYLHNIRVLSRIQYIFVMWSGALQGPGRPGSRDFPCHPHVQRKSNAPCEFCLMGLSVWSFSVAKATDI
jgi:hypothetical protein